MNRKEEIEDLVKIGLQAVKVRRAQRVKNSCGLARIESASRKYLTESAKLQKLTDEYLAIAKNA